MIGNVLSAILTLSIHIWLLQLAEVIQVRCANAHKYALVCTAVTCMSHCHSSFPSVSLPPSPFLWLSVHRSPSLYCIPSSPCGFPSSINSAFLSLPASSYLSPLHHQSLHEYLYVLCLSSSLWESESYCTLSVRQRTWKPLTPACCAERKKILSYFSIYFKSFLLTLFTQLPFCCTLSSIANLQFHLHGSVLQCWLYNFLSLLKSLIKWNSALSSQLLLFYVVILFLFL